MMHAPGDAVGQQAKQEHEHRGFGCARRRNLEADGMTRVVVLCACELRHRAAFDVNSLPSITPTFTTAVHHFHVAHVLFVYRY